MGEYLTRFRSALTFLWYKGWNESSWDPQFAGKCSW